MIIYSKIKIALVSLFIISCATPFIKDESYLYQNRNGMKILLSKNYTISFLLRDDSFHSQMPVLELKKEITYLINDESWFKSKRGDVASVIGKPEYGVYFERRLNGEVYSAEICWKDKKHFFIPKKICSPFSLTELSELQKELAKI